MLIDDEIVLRLILGELGLKLSILLAHSSLELLSLTVFQLELLIQIVYLQLVVRRACPHGKVLLPQLRHLLVQPAQVALLPIELRFHGEEDSLVD